MTKDPINQTVAEMDDLLERERAALLDGNLDAIPGLLSEKEALFDRLAELDRLERAGLKDLQGKVMRNQALLDSAMRGIRAVADRMSVLRRVSQTLETYDASGRRESVPTGRARKVERRA